MRVKIKVMRWTCRVWSEEYGNHQCGVCRKGVAINSILCIECLRWVHERCNGIKGKLISNYCMEWTIVDYIEYTENIRHSLFISWRSYSYNSLGFIAAYIIPDIADGLHSDLGEWPMSLHCMVPEVGCNLVDYSMTAQTSFMISHPPRATLSLRAEAIGVSALSMYDCSLDSSKNRSL